MNDNNQETNKSITWTKFFLWMVGLVLFLVLSICLWRYKRIHDFYAEWDEYLECVEMHLPELITDSFPEVGKVSVTASRQDEGVSNSWTKHDFTNIISLSIDGGEALEAYPVSTQCTIIGNVGASLASNLQWIKQTYAPSFDKMTGNDDRMVYVADMLYRGKFKTIYHFEIKTSGRELLVEPNDSTGIACIVDSRSNAIYERDYSSGRFVLSSSLESHKGVIKHQGSKKPGSSSRNKDNALRDSYDDGFEDIYLNDDYDDDRYRSDWDYANGVDDAMDDE